MIKIALKNYKTLAFINKLPIIKHFFILKLNRNFEEIKDNRVLEKFYKDIYVHSKTSKKTANNRFADINKASLKYLSKNKLNVIHDIAVSSGITSDNWYEFLTKKNIPFALNISDKYALMFVKEGFTTKAFDTDKKLTFAYWGIFFAGNKNIFFPLTVLLYQIIMKLSKKFEYDYSIYLFHPDILEKVSAHKIRIVDYDIFNTDIYDKYTFIRCMNILNKGYFTDNNINAALTKVKQSLKENGILLIGRTTNNEVNHVSFFKKINGRFEHLKDINTGSEIIHLVLNM